MASVEWPHFKPAGDAAVVVEFGDCIDPILNRKVHALAQAIRMQPLPGVAEPVPTYRSLLVHYDPAQLGYHRLVDWIRLRLESADPSLLPPPRRVEIPTVYGGGYGPDLDFVAAQHHLTPQDVIRIHSETEYLVYMMGFTPGFAYLGEVPEDIATPRLPKPRTHVPAGSVGIAGKQTGIYPIDSPGGWQIIGYTPLRWFNPHADPPSSLSAGDLVRFVPIPASEASHVA